ncbi:MAG: hypothetical protein ACRDHE_10600, partial [Ktedonobacterales bacterium]
MIEMHLDCRRERFSDFVTDALKRRIATKEKRGVTHARSRLGRVLTAGLLIVGYLVCVMGFEAPSAQAASSQGSVSIVPSNGPVGTPVQVGINLNPATPTDYVLSYTLTAPDKGGCASAQPVPGVATITVSSNGGGANFAWPNTLDQGPYWLCASPTSGNGPTAQSSGPYTVLASSPPTATPASIAPTPSVTVMTPADQLLPGANVTVSVMNWLPADNSAPQTVNLLSQDNSGPANGTGFGDNLPFTATAGGSGSYTLTVALPQNTTPATYAFQVLGTNG